MEVVTLRGSGIATFIGIQKLCVPNVCQNVAEEIKWECIEAKQALDDYCINIDKYSAANFTNDSLANVLSNMYCILNGSHNLCHFER